jgi:hypothetical protein
VLSSLAGSYVPLAFLAAAIIAVGAGIVWLVFTADWSYMFEQNTAYPLLAGLVLVVAIVAAMAIRIVDATRAARYCPNCLGDLISQKTFRPEEFGPHKVRTRKL